MSDPRLWGTYAKIGRAKKHLKDLNREVRFFLDASPYRLVSDPDRQPGSGQEFLYRIHIERNPPPRLALIVGDIVHNLQSALDHLMWQLVLVAGGYPTAQTMFPVVWDKAKAADPKWYAWQFGRKVRGASATAIALVDRFQPCHVPDPDHNLLTMLHRLDVRDKHQTLHVMGGASGPAGIVIGTPTDTFYTQFTGSPDDAVSPLEENAVVLRLPGDFFRPFIGQNLTQAQVKAYMPFTVVIQDAAPGENWLLDSLPALVRFVRFTVRRFEVQFFDS